VVAGVPSGCAWPQRSGWRLYAKAPRPQKKKQLRRKKTTPAACFNTDTSWDPPAALKADAFADDIEKVGEFGRPS
jgi:hypothetical protein